MSWIESHQSLLTHRKLLRLSAILKKDKFTMIGHLHALWWWGLDNAKDDGDLGSVYPSELAEAAGWKGKPEALVEALAEVGFLDVDGSVKLHDWWEYAGKLNAKRARDRERKRTEVAGISTGASTGTALEIHDESQAPTYLPNQPDQPYPQTDQNEDTSRLSNDLMIPITTGPNSPGNAEHLINYEKSRRGRVSKATENGLPSSEELERRRNDPAWDAREH